MEHDTPSDTPPRTSQTSSWTSPEGVPMVPMVPSLWMADMTQKERKAMMRRGSQAIYHDAERYLNVEVAKLEQERLVKEHVARAQERDQTLRSATWKKYWTSARRSMVPMVDGGIEIVDAPEAALARAYEAQVKKIDDRMENRKKRGSSGNPGNPGNEKPKPDKRQRVEAAIEILLDESAGLDEDVVSGLIERKVSLSQEREEEEEEEEEKKKADNKVISVSDVIETILDYCVELTPSHVAKLKEIQAVPNAAKLLNTYKPDGSDYDDEMCCDDNPDLFVRALFALYRIALNIDRAYYTMGNYFQLGGIGKLFENARNDHQKFPGVVPDVEQYDDDCANVYSMYLSLESRYPGRYIEHARVIWYLVADFWGFERESDYDLKPESYYTGFHPGTISGMFVCYPPPLRHLRLGPTARVVRVLSALETPE